MDVVISHKRALWFWRKFRGNIRALERVALPEAMIHPVPFDAGLLAELEALGVEVSEKKPLDLLFYKSCTKSRSQRISAHTTSRQLPAGSLVRLSDRVLIASPELVFAQVAEDYSLEQLIMVGCELCGAYRLLDDDGQPLPLPEERPRLTSAAEIARLLREQGFCSRARAMTAARFVLDNARSPMEAKTALLLCLPKWLGGFALPRPVLNPEFRLGPEALALYPHNPCHPDLFWIEARLDVEYDGGDTHTAEAHAKDVARLMAFRREGLEVLTLAKAQVYDESAFLIVAEIIAGRLHRKLPALTPAFGAAHAQLREELGL